MTERNLFDAITDTPDDMIDEAGSIRLKTKRIIPWRAIVAVAACLAVVIGGSMFFHPIESGTMDVLLPSPPSTKPSIPEYKPNSNLISGTASLEPLIKVAYPKAYGFYEIGTKNEVFDNNPLDKEFLKAVNDFSYKTTSELLSNESGNQNYSPLSLYYALAIAATGANGETATQLYDLLGVDSREELSVQCGNLYRRLYKDNEIGQLKIANSLWMNKDVSFYEEFVRNAAEQFYASSYSVDFSDEATGKAMGQWIADNTNGTLAPTVETKPNDLMHILNTVYFYDEWQAAFSEKETKPDTFYLSGGGTVSCDFMNRSPWGHFARGNGFTRAALSLKNGGQMVFILPDEEISPRELIATPEKMAEVFGGEDNLYGQITWQIPKFDFSSKYTELVDTLKALNVTAPFEDADFSAMTDHLAFISRIQQETTISIDEKGVEASAYTDIVFKGTSMPEQKVDMILDRSFLYGIRSQDGTLLFVGICENPTAK